ncbi:hypothetical protein EUTSA_v10003415mg [Eutrema salsugineum]|uniref:Retrovirus-related Pol polyprotein from transposon TNT 1-94-like beta-barrel domain-containing protein n=1 Tax=Eutrema salsugineum TaxID=72664 RepID=V4L386_EUTSA|nr:hypothetical protein EUTSA_v10003415mg [Eutrema salsugineum]
MYVLSMPMPTVPEDAENESLEGTRKQLKWENNDYICRGLILNGMSDPLFDVYQNFESAKDLWDALESKYMAEDASSKMFLPVMEQYNELLRILRQFAQHNIKIDESISVSSIIDKFPPSWKNFKHMLKHKKEELSLVQLGSHLQVGTSSINMMEENGNSKKNKGKKRSFNNNTYDGSNKRLKSVCWICNKPGHFKLSWWIDSGATTHVCKDHGWFKSYEPVQDGSVLHMGNESTAPILGRERLKVSTYMSVKCCRFKKLGLGFVYTHE